jgi:hypothetical protein
MFKYCEARGEPTPTCLGLTGLVVVVVDCEARGALPSKAQILKAYDQCIF